MNSFDFDVNSDKAHEECGVFGIYRVNDELDCVSIAQDALYGLQHRGQESAGIAVNKDGEFICVKDLGKVSAVFSDKNLSKLPNGKIVLGHVRYTPFANLDRASSQPLVIRYIKGSLAISHNGSITNYTQIRNELESGGAIFQSNSNAELIAYVIATQRINSSSIEEAVIKSAEKIEGAYSLILSSPNKLIALRDPHGFRPLCLGKLLDSYVVTSESCALDSIGAKFLRDIKPGEMLVIDDKGLHSQIIKTAEKTSFCMFEYVYIARPDSVINGVSVHLARKKAGEILYKEHPVEADIVCGVPDSGLDAAQGFSKASGIPYAIGFVKNKYIGRQISGRHQDKKERLLKTKLNALKANVEGKRVVIIDDSIIRGNTSKHIVKLLRDAGAVQVHMRISSPPFRHPCYFGTDIKSQDELIANRMTADEICRYIGADSLGYLSLDGLSKIADNAEIGFCDGCFSGNYCAPIPQEEFVDKYSQKLINIE